MIDKKQRNKFGNVAEAYIRYRKDYSRDVYDKIFNFASKKKISVLDIGCGTGITTKRLAKHYNYVTGIDKEKGMIDYAQQKKTENVNFTVAAAEHLPFKNDNFDLIICAGSFHWFKYEVALLEIKRVLKKNGKLCIFWKTSEAPMLLSDFAWRNVQKYLPRYKKYQESSGLDISLLYFNGFNNIRSELIPFTEKYSAEDYLGYLQSHSTYNLLSEKQKNDYLKDNRREINKHLVKGKYYLNGFTEMWFGQR